MSRYSQLHLRSCFFFAETFFKIFFYWDISVICLTVVIKLTIAVHFQTFWPKWLNFFRLFQKHIGLWPKKTSYEVKDIFELPGHLSVQGRLVVLSGCMPCVYCSFSHNPKEGSAFNCARFELPDRTIAVAVQITWPCGLLVTFVSWLKMIVRCNRNSLWVPGVDLCKVVSVKCFVQSIFRVNNVQLLWTRYCVI